MNFPIVSLKVKKSRPIEMGHPWIFSGAIASITGSPQESCGLVQVQDHNHKLLGWGLYSSKSQIRVRMLDVHPDFEGPLSVEFFEKKFRSAISKRQVLGLPSEHTNGFRLINSEGDGLPGLIIDIYANLAVMQLTTYPMTEHREMILEALRACFSSPTTFAIREVSAPSKIAAIEGFTRVDQWHTPFQPPIVWFQENGVSFNIATENFQKTGHFVDMRPHREWIARRAEGRTVLDAYSYTGAFGLQCARHGAKRVVCVDSSQLAIDSLQRNIEYNQFDIVETQCSKVDNYIRSAYDRGESFDIIVLDPPKLAPSSRHLTKALKAYESLCVQALRILSHGGILAVGSCSEAIGLPELERMLTASAARLQRRIYAVHSGTQAPDHPSPVAMPEGRYISFIACMG